MNESKYQKSNENIDDEVDMLRSSKKDSVQENDEANNFADEAKKEYGNRNKMITVLFEIYNDNTERRMKTNRRCKKITFWFLLISIFTLTLSIIGLFIVLLKYNLINDSIAIIISACVTYLGSLLSILQIITKYLFPNNEDKNVLDLLKTIIEKDNNLDNSINK